MSVGGVKAEPCPFCGKSTAPEHIRYDNCFVVRCLHCGYVSAHTASERGAIENHNKICRLLPKPDPDWKDICAKCRDGEIEPDCEYYGEPNGCNSPIYGNHPTTEKSSAVGNAAAMREALKNLVDVIDRCDSGSPLWWHSGAKGVVPLKNAKAALAKPPRQCDVGTPEEQVERFMHYCNSRVCKRRVCASCGYEELFRHKCFAVWAQMPYEKGETNGR